MVVWPDGPGRRLHRQHRSRRWVNRSRPGGSSYLAGREEIVAAERPLWTEEIAAVFGAARRVLGQEDIRGDACSELGWDMLLRY
jgi:hypothetical protein